MSIKMNKDERESFSVWLRGKLLHCDKRISLWVQDEKPPYAYVSVEGPIIEIAKDDRELHEIPMAIRYLGEQDGREYIVFPQVQVRPTQAPLGVLILNNVTQHPTARQACAKHWPHNVPAGDITLSLARLCAGGSPKNNKEFVYH